jgi:hypothetical protein
VASDEIVVFQRLQAALLHTQKGLTPFVVERMTNKYGPEWSKYATRAPGAAPGAALDAYGLLKTMLDRWNEAFTEAFDRFEVRRAHNFLSLAFDARNALAHHSTPLKDEEALRHLDSFHQLLIYVRAPLAEIAEVKRLYDEQRRPRNERSTKQGGTEPRQGTLAQRLLAFVQKNPDLDDDELALKLGASQRQAINIAARKLERAGKLKRFRGPQGKLVNRVV